jgi:nickel-dependent lactate racemase
LRRLGRGKKVCVIVPDETRACPTRKILSTLIEELEISKPLELKILIGNGLHRQMSEQEMVELLGEEVIEAIVNRVAAKSDYLLGIGLRARCECETTGLRGHDNSI